MARKWKIFPTGLAWFFYPLFLPFLAGQGLGDMPVLQPSRVQYISRDIPSATRCFKNVILGDDGRIWFNPCYNENLLYDLHLVQFDGYDLYPVSLKDSSVFQSFSSMICGVTPDRQVFGFSENLEMNYLFLMDPYNQRLRTFDFGAPPSPRGQIRNVIYSQEGRLIVLTQSEAHLRLFEMAGDTVRQILQVERRHPDWAVSGQSVGKLPLLATDQGLWFMDDYLPLYCFDPVTAALSEWDAPAFSPSLKKLDRVPSPENKLLHYREGLTLLLPGYNEQLFQIDLAGGKAITPVRGFPADWQARYATTDRAGNLLFVFQDGKGEGKAILQDTNGQRYDYSTFLELAPRHLYNIVGNDFFRQVFFCWENSLISSGVRNLKGMHTFPGEYMRGIPGALTDEDFLFYDNRSQILVLNAEGIRPATAVTQESGGHCLLDLIPGSTNMLRSMYFDSAGYLWTHQSDNIIRYNPRDRSCTAFSTGGFFITRFSFMGDQTIAFVSTQGTLHLFDIPTGVTTPAPVEATTPGFTYDIRATPDSVIWVPTSDGLWRVDCRARRSEVLGFEEPFQDSRFQAIDIDDRGRIWLGSVMRGLHIYDPSSGKVQVIDRNQGLAGNTVWSILTDDDGVKWIGTNNGLSLISPAGEVLANLSQEDGLPDNEFRIFGGKRSRSGLLLFATRNGMVLIEPESLKPYLSNIPPGPVYLTSLSYYNTEQDTDITQTIGLDRLPTLRLPASHRYLRLRFALPAYVDPSQNQFAYRLEGHDADWNYIGARQELNLPDLPAGRYRILIKGSDYRRRWSEEPLIIALDVKDYFYRQVWFYILCMLVVLGVAAVWLRRQRLENKRLEAEVQKRTETIRKDKQLIEEQVEALREKNREIVKAQQQILLQEKLASLGQLTAGIAHEIKNPLNFINNFAGGSIELVDELIDNLAQHQSRLGSELYDQLRDYLQEVRQNAADIEKSGKKVDRIVRSMMDHARGTRDELEATDINELIEENLNLAYHSYRAKDPSFFIDLQTTLDPALLPVRVFPQNLSRVLLNIFDNAFYAVGQKQKTSPPGFRPALRVNTQTDGHDLVIRIRDNGPGIPAEIREEIFTPFYTTKPTGAGNTGLGLSLSYDIVVKEHLGKLEVESEPGAFTEFVITLPLEREQAGIQGVV